MTSKLYVVVLLVNFVH